LGGAAVDLALDIGRVDRLAHVLDGRIPGELELAGLCVGSDAGDVHQ